MRPNVIQTTFSWICHVIFCLHVWMTCRTGLRFADEWVEGVENILMNLHSLSSFTMGDNGLGSSTKKAPRGFNRLIMSNFSAHDCNTLSSCFTFTPLTFPHLHHYVSGCSQGASTSHICFLIWAKRTLTLYGWIGHTHPRVTCVAS